jgi:hypothetical protein
MSADESVLIRDVSESLRKLISENIAELNQKVTLESPAEIDIQPSSEDKLSLFLYQILENPDLKNQYSQQMQASMDRRNVNMNYPPLALDLFYLLTLFFRDKDKEQIALTKLVRLLYDNATLSGTALGNNLLLSGNSELRIELITRPMEQINQLWSLFQGKPYRLSLSYVVTPLRIPSTRDLGQQRVISKHTDYYYWRKEF